METVTESNTLKREIGVRNLAAFAINNTVGGGIFVLLAVVALKLASAGVLAYLVCGVLMMFIMLCFAELGSRITKTGGAYAYIEAAFGPYAGFLTNSMFWFGGGVISDAAIANALVNTTSIAIPLLSQDFFRALFFVLLYSGLTYFNIKGVKDGVRIVELSTYAKLIPLVLIIITGIFFIKPANLSWTIQPNFFNIGEVSLVLFFAFLGPETALSASGEIKNPKRTIPLGIIIGIISIIVLYVSLQIVAQGVLGASLPSFKDAPLQALANITMGNWGVLLITVGAGISIFGAVSGGLLGSSRLLYVAATDGLLPKYLSKIHSRYATPYWAIVTYSVLVVIFAITGGFRLLAIVSSASYLLIYLGVIAAMIKFRIQKIEGLKDGFKVFGGFTIPIIATLTIIWLLSNLAKEEAIGIGISISVLSLIYLIMKLISQKSNKVNQH